jgi:hypothetical protein
MKAKTWLGRYHTKLQKLTTQKPQKPWRHHSKGRYKHTASEKAALKEKRLAHRITYVDALKDAREVMQEQAKLLHEKFGGHSIQYYHEELMQRARMAASSRSPSRWNTFVRREVKRMNQGMCVLTCCLELCSVSCTFRTSPWFSFPQSFSLRERTCGVLEQHVKRRARERDCGCYQRS